MLKVIGIVQKEQTKSMLFNASRRLVIASIARKTR
jgi:hypothetical protein